MSIREALADKELIHQEKRLKYQKEMALLNQSFSRSSLFVGPQPPNPDTVKAVIDAEKDKWQAYMHMQTLRLNQEGEDPTPQMPRITSVSRLVVFMTGHAAIGIATSLTSCAIYYLLVNPKGTELPSFNSLVGVILALGIGVVPYAITRLTTNNEEPETPSR